MVCCSVRPRCAARRCLTTPHRQQLRNAVVTRSTVADVETAELDAATPEQVDAAVAAPTEGIIAVNAEPDQRSNSGRQGRQQGNGRRQPRVSMESISVDQEMEGVVVRLLHADGHACCLVEHSFLLPWNMQEQGSILLAAAACCATYSCFVATLRRKTWLTSAALLISAAARMASSTSRSSR